MHQLTGDSKYIDVLSALYNGALAGISLNGDLFFYVNPWHRTVIITEGMVRNGLLSSQVSRFLPSIGNYIYSTSKEAVWVNLYIGNSAEVGAGKTVRLTQETGYPWDGV